MKKSKTIALLQVPSPCGFRSVGARKNDRWKWTFSSTHSALLNDNYSCIYYHQLRLFFVIDNCFFHMMENAIFEQMALGVIHSFAENITFDCFSITFRHLDCLCYLFSFFLHLKCELRKLKAPRKWWKKAIGIKSIFTQKSDLRIYILRTPH